MNPRFLTLLVLAILTVALVGCGPRHNKDKKKTVYGPPKNAQDAAWRWPGDKIEARDDQGTVAMRLRTRGARIRVFGHKMRPLGDIRRDGDGYLLSNAEGKASHRIQPPAAESDAWTVCAFEGDDCKATGAQITGGHTVRLMRADASLALARPDGNGAFIERGGGGYRLTRQGKARFNVSSPKGTAGTVTGAQSPFTLAAIVAEELDPLVRAGLVVLIEDHHGKWSRKP